ncbi:MAG: heme ABC exporter ATP-binding protein CcmA [Chloroflexi bacterium]|nr:heme ABC exporter ATP-binding protein CcmA [Chloroflexota bacterium]
MIEISGLHKAFGDYAVLRGVSLAVPQGEFLALLGPNGAGKTTLVRILATLAQASAGRCRLAGLDVARHSEAVRRRIGLVSHQPLLYGDLSARENLRFYGRLYGLRQAHQRIEGLLDQVGLLNRSDELVRTFSRGMQQRLAIARAILHDPPVLLLDEPDTGLDPHAAERLQAILEDLATQGRTVLMTTHDLPRALAMASQVAILAGGRMAFHGLSRDLDAPGLRAQYDKAAEGARRP